MEKVIETIMNLVYKIIDIDDENNKKELQFFIKDIYEVTEKIYYDFDKVLQEAYNALDNEEMSVDEAVKYFDNSRLPFKSARAKVRGMMTHPYYCKNTEIRYFAIGVIGVLEGGLHETAEFTIIPRKSENTYIYLDKISLKGYHTIVDIIKTYDRTDPRSIFNRECYINDINAEEKIKQNLMSHIKRQQRTIERSWQRVCDYYPKIMMP